VGIGGHRLRIRFCQIRPDQERMGRIEQ
jgi:hypothetical protein